MLHKGIVTITNRKFHFLLVQRLYTNFFQKFGTRTKTGHINNLIYKKCNHVPFVLIKERESNYYGKYKI